METPPGKLLLGQIGITALLSLMSIWLATQWVVLALSYPVQFGEPWITFGIPLYPPWKLFVWDYEYGAYAPDVFISAMHIAYSGSFLGVATAFILAIIRAKTSRKATTYGSARWAEGKDLDRANLTGNRGVVLGITKDGQYLRHDGPEHIKVIAPTRTGKGVGIVIPTLLVWPESVLVYDLKSENWKSTAGYRNRFSNTIYFNPNELDSAHFNPLLEVRLGDLEVRDVQNIADMIVDPDGKGMGDHWAKTGHSLLVGTILHVLYAESDKTLAGVANFLSSPTRNIVQTLEAMMHAQHSDFGTHPVVAAAARDMLNKSENERSGVLSTAMSFLSLYRDPIVARNTSDSDFRITDLMQDEKPVSLYLVIPPSDINRLRPLFRLMVNQICRRLTEELNPTGNRHRLLLLLDEFPALGRLDFFESALGVIAGYGIKAMLISQSTNQLDKTYGTRNSILDNAHVRVFFAPNTIETAEVISRTVGQKTEIHQQRNYAGNRLAPWLGHVMVADQETARPLLTPGEVMELSHSDELVFIAGHPPIRATKIRYYDDPLFLKRVVAPPLMPRQQYSQINASIAHSPSENGQGQTPLSLDLHEEFLP